MAITIDGTAGTIAGLVAGGLPDGIVDADMLATSAVTSVKILDGTIASGDVNDLAASKLTGALPAIDGSNLTGISSGGLVKLGSTAVTSGTAAIIFNSSVVTAYDNYYILLNGIKVSNAAGSGAVMFSTDNGSTFIGRTRFTARYDNLSTGIGGSNHTGTFSLNSVTNPVMWDNHTTEGLCGHFNFYNCNPSTDNTFSAHCIYQSSYTNQNGVEYHQTGTVMYDVTAGQQVNYFKIVNATQNIDEGRATLYGFSQ